MNPFGHIDIRVLDMKSALSFYSQFLPELGFSVRDTILDPGETWETFATAGYPNSPFISIVEDKTHVPNKNCIAFHVQSNLEVDRIAKLVLKASATDIEGPEAIAPEQPEYYAFFFKDPSGNRLEIYHYE